MKPRAGIGRAGLLSLTAAVLLAHGLVVSSVADTWSTPSPTTAAPVISQVRLVQPPPPPPAPAAPSPPRPTPTASATATPPAATRKTPPRTTQPEPAAAEVAPPASVPEPITEPITEPVSASPPPEAPAVTTQDSDADRPTVALPPDVDLVYQVQGQARGLAYRASGELRWRRTGDAYELSMQLSAFLIGSRSQSSVGSVDATGLLPDRFSDRTRSERAAHFDRAGQRIRFSNNAPDAELLPGAQDRLSVFMQLAGLLGSGTVTDGDIVELPVAGVGASELWRFSVGQLEALELPAGPLQARRLVREPAEPRDSRVEVWLAPELGHLPVRLRITQSQGDVADQQLSRRP